MANGRHLKNRFFRHNSATDCPISVKSCKGEQNSMVIWGDVTQTLNFENSA